MPNLVPLEPLFEAFGGWGLEDGLPFKKSCVYFKKMCICAVYIDCVCSVFCVGIQDYW